MENPIQTQLLHFAAAIAFGGLAGIWFALCSLFGFMGSKGRRLLFDVLFWVVLLPAALLFLLLLNGGGPRGYLLVGMAGGLLAVRFTLGAGLARLLAPLRRRLVQAKYRRHAKRNRKETIWQRKRQNKVGDPG